MAKIGVLGAWHLGIVAATCLAEQHDVWIHDKSASDSLKKGIPVVDEPGIASLLKSRLNKSMHIVEPKEAISGKEFIIIAHDSPVSEEDVVDISPILESADQIKQYADSNPIVVIMSQVPIGTCKKIQESLKLPVLYVPENLRLGQAIQCFTEPDVLVVGSDSKENAEKVSSELYSVVKGKRAFLNVANAEMWKHSMNTYLASMITLANSLADVCEHHGANISDVVKTLKMDTRVSSKAPLGAGLGFGGGTLGREVNVLQNLAKKSGVSSKFFDAVLESNKERPLQVIKKLGNVKGKRIAVLGMAYKQGTNTLRRSIGLFIANKLRENGAIVSVFDPAISEIPGFVSSKSVEDASKNADAIMLVTDWPQFRQINWNSLQSIVHNAFILDCRNMMNSEEITSIKNAGFVYRGIGI